MGYFTVDFKDGVTSADIAKFEETMDEMLDEAYAYGYYEQPYCGEREEEVCKEWLEQIDFLICKEPEQVKADTDELLFQRICDGFDAG